MFARFKTLHKTLERKPVSGRGGTHSLVLTFGRVERHGLSRCYAVIFELKMKNA